MHLFSSWSSMSHFLAPDCAVSFPPTTKWLHGMVFCHSVRSGINVKPRGGRQRKMWDKVIDMFVSLVL